jgi:hypothetical protein
MVTSAPLFSRPVPLSWGGTEERDGHYVLRFTSSAGASAPDLADVVRARLSNP